MLIIHEDHCLEEFTHFYIFEKLTGMNVSLFIDSDCKQTDIQTVWLKYYTFGLSSRKRCLRHAPSGAERTAPAALHVNKT